MIEKTLKVEGMHCKKCVAKVETVLKDNNATSVMVNPDQNEVSAFFEKEISDSILNEAIQKAGFVVISIQ